MVGIKPHPSLVSNELQQPAGGQGLEGGEGNTQQQQNTNPQMNAGDAGEQKSFYAIIQNQRVDAYTLRFLSFLLPSFPNFVSLKLVNNNLSVAVQSMLLGILTTPNSPIQKLFFDWNPHPNANSSFFPALGTTNLEFLILRSCGIDDATVISLVKNLSENPNTKVKYIELYNNNVKGAGIEAISEFIQNYSKVEYIGLAKNDIDNLEPLKSLFAAIGRRVLSAEELAIYREKEKEKESIISKAVKNKKKVTEDMYPHLDPLVSLPDGSFAVITNPQMKMINLSMNSLTFDHDAEYFEKYLTIIPEELQIVLIQNSIEAKYKDKLKKKYRKNIQI